MDRIEFRTEIWGPGHSSRTDTVLHPVINGRPLRDLAAAVERTVASRSDRTLAGSYAALPTSRVGWPSRHFLGDPLPDLIWFGDGDTILMGCECGEPGCWPLTAQIRVEAGLVTWEGFRQGHRDWDLSALGPFRFAEADYREALEGTAPGAATS